MEKRLLQQQFVPAPRLVGVEPNPGPPKSKRLSEEERWRVVHYSTLEHLSIRRIAQKMQISKTTVAQLLKKFQQTGLVSDLARTGRKRKISEQEENKIVKKAKKEKPASEIARELSQESKNEVSVDTVRRILHKHNLRWLVKQKVEALSEVNKAKRLDYALEMNKFNWKRVLFSDEKSFFVGSFETHCWQEIGKRVTRSFTRHPPKLHVWAAAGYYMKSKLFFFTENLTSDLYQRILRQRLPEDHLIYAPDCPPSLPAKWVFMQDNDPKHKSNDTMNFLQERVGDRILHHPSQSPDLNIVEDLWSYLDRKVKASHVKSIDALKRKLKKEWDLLSWDEIRKTVDSMPARLAECVQLQGARTHY